ncbi:MAG: WYL domain-containing protein [Salana multivorans]|nr:WYL domain-containing protein [Salana multivorans]
MATVSPAERLFDLVIALRNARAPMSRAQIRSGVNGYHEAENDAAFERMFERDKVALRELGIPLLTITGDAHGDEYGYRIDVSDYDLPPSELTPEEIGVLGAAAQVWDGADRASPARRGLTKLLAVAPASTDPLAGRLRLPTPDEQFDALLAAISQRRLVTFAYRAAHSGATQERVVEPWRLLVSGGAWYLQGYDRVRAGERLFRLSRVAGGVRVLPPDESERQPVGPAYEGRRTRTDAVLLVRPDRATALRLRAASVEPDARPGYDRVVLAPGDLGDLASLVAGYADAVVVLEPPELVDAVRTRLLAVAALDAGDADA